MAVSKKASKKARTPKAKAKTKAKAKSVTRERLDYSFDASSLDKSENWKDKNINEARATHHGVRVKGKEYGSVWAAFVALKLEDFKGMHQRFRKALKLSKGGKLALTANGKRYDFALVK